MTGHDLEDLFAQMEAHGLRPHDGLTVDGAIHRFDVPGDKPRSRNGWYIAYADAPANAVYGSFKRQERYTWHGSRKRSTPNQKPISSQEIAEQRRRRKIADAERQDEAARNAVRIWRRSGRPDPEHPYLVGKRVRSHGLRQYRRALVASMQDVSGRLRNLQFIDERGQKRVLPGALAAELFHVIGRSTKRVWLCEGIATGASLHERTQEQVIVTFGCQNLLPVALAIQSAWQPEEISVMADDDFEVLGNPGRAAAQEVSEALGCRWYIPEFPPERPPWATDFNDALRLWMEISIPVVLGS